MERSLRQHVILSPDEPGLRTWSGPRAVEMDAPLRMTEGTNTDV